ncbi:MAG: phosphoglucosamine mutase [Candidatus Latescibacterota bacterium]
MSADLPLIVSISGIRGLVGRTLTDEVVRRFAAAFAASLPPGARVVLARDTRPSGPGFAAQIARELQESGCHVLDLDVCSTPGAKLMVLELEAQGAIIVTASHNPGAWNGLKLIRGDGIFLNQEQGERVLRLFEARRSHRQGGGRLERVDPAAVKERHLQRIVAHVDAAAIRSAGLSAVVDPCNGTGSLLVPGLLRALGVRTAVIHGEPSGLFAHEPEPLPANLADLGEAVRRNGASVGFAVDPDADRVSLVDESGRPVGEDYTLALAVQAVTARAKGTVVTTLSTSQTVTDAARRNGCPVLLTPVGEVHVVEKMLAEGAVIGGEGNGGVVLTQIDPGRDAAVGVAVVLEAMAGSGRPLSALVADLPAYAICKRKVGASPQALRQAVQRLRSLYPEAYLHPVEDGAKLYLQGGMDCPWIHLRPSNTEPVVRIIAESQSAAEAEGLCREAEELLREGEARG